MTGATYIKKAPGVTQDYNYTLIQCIVFLRLFANTWRDKHCIVAVGSGEITWLPSWVAQLVERVIRKTCRCTVDSFLCFRGNVEMNNHVSSTFKGMLYVFSTVIVAVLLKILVSPMALNVNCCLPFNRQLRISFVC